MLGFKKMDEMEMSISLKAIKISWAYTALFLAIWSIHDTYKNTVSNLAPFLVSTQTLILLGVQSFLKWKLGKDEK